MLVAVPLLSAPLNHLLAQSDWASARLRPYSGKIFALICGPLRARLQITEAGHFVEAAVASADDVVITLPADAPLRGLFDPAAAMAGASLQGSADLAETLGFVLRNLRWDAEADLARLTGDIVARRLFMGLQSFAQAQSRALANVGANVSEYLIDEQGAVVQHAEITGWQRDIERLSAEVDGLEARLAGLRR